MNLDDVILSLWESPGAPGTMEKLAPLLPGYDEEKGTLHSLRNIEGVGCFVFGIDYKGKAFAGRISGKTEKLFTIEFTTARVID